MRRFVLLLDCCCILWAITTNTRAHAHLFGKLNNKVSSAAAASASLWGTTTTATATTSSAATKLETEKDNLENANATTGIPASENTTDTIASDTSIVSASDLNNRNDGNVPFEQCVNNKNNHNNNNGNPEPSYSTSEINTADNNNNNKNNNGNEESSSVGVKEHNHKKSNAVGDPDGEGSDDDTEDDTDEDFSDWEELFDETDIDLLHNNNHHNNNNDEEEEDTILETTQLQLEVEYVDEDDEEEAEEEESAEDDNIKREFTTATAATTTTTKGSGGVGVRFGSRYYHRKSPSSSSSSSSSSLRRGGGDGRKELLHQTQHQQQQAQTQTPPPQSQQAATVAAWQPFVYIPPSKSALDYLTNNARTIDGAGKMRLDRRTLYAGLLLEWNNSGSTYRKFLESSTSQALQAALSLATQPEWRKSFPQTSGIRLYNIETDMENSNVQIHQQQQQYSLDPMQQQQQQQQQSTPAAATANKKQCTLAMQETIAMALAHSLGAGFVVLDDKILANVRMELLKSGFVNEGDEDIKPVNLIKALLAIARQGELTTSDTLSRNTNNNNHNKASTTTNETTKRWASITNSMKHDLKSGLDDPFDERAAASCQDMAEWEEAWVAADGEDKDDAKHDAKDSKLPLVIFIRTESCNSILKSKSAVDYLLKECDSPESINLLVLGKGIDATTDSLPQESSNAMEGNINSNMMTNDSNMMGPPQLQQNLPGAAPWFGFTPHNQNASGQNDPEGSRRFNIFLARTMDPNGTPGIVGAIAPPQAGNLFPHMMAMQARARLQQTQQDDSPMREQLERWAQMLQQQMQTSGGNPLPPPQFFNATLSVEKPDGSKGGMPPNLPPEVIQQTLEHAMAELLDRLAQMNDNEASPDMTPELQRAFSQVLRNENLRRGIAENLARAAPALSDPKCQGVLLSVYVPPPPNHFNRGKLPNNTGNRQQPQQQQQGDKMGGWFNKILNSQEEGASSENNNGGDGKQKRVRTMAAAAAVMAAQNAQKSKDAEKQENKVERNLARLESACRPITVKTPSDPVRAKSWDAWIGRERGSVIFRQNRRVLNEKLEKHFLSLQEHTGTRGAGSALRSMLSIRPIVDEMDDVIKCSIELEAAKSQRQHKSPDEIHENEMSLEVDITLSQLLLTDDGIVETEEYLPAAVTAAAEKRRDEKTGVHFIHPSSLESALTMVCRITPSPAGGLSLSSATSAITHRSREEIAALAQDKHERALVSQVVSPQDIGVTYDMIGGLTDVKELLRQSITYPLKFPHLYCEGIAREAVKGVLLFGPPGTGKTMLAKAVATEGGASFLSVDASSVENKWLGESEKNAKAVFTLARRLAPCVIFIDEVDSLLSSRDGTSDDSAHGTLTSVKTTMMSEWDGLNSGTNGQGEAGSDRVVVIGSTNRPFDLDEAVLRRFPRRILVDLPDLETRSEILEVTLAENRLDASVNLTKIAERLEGYTGSDIKEVCREAVVQISHEQAKLLDQGFLNTKEDVTQGSLQRLRPVTNEDFEKALSKLKRSVSEKGRELARVWEWNDEYGEIKKEKKNLLPHLANMYL